MANLEIQFNFTFWHQDSTDNSIPFTYNTIASGNLFTLTSIFLCTVSSSLSLHIFYPFPKKAGFLNKEMVENIIGTLIILIAKSLVTASRTLQGTELRITNF
jgi:hypothetical protein